MKIDFSKLNLSDRPTLILENTAGTPIGVLGYAKDVCLDIKYNEASVLEFSIPKRVDGEFTPHYSRVIGLRQVCLQDIGRFILMDPSETGDGVKTTKNCKAYSLEYEFTFKKITIPKGTYNFYNPVSTEGTLIDMVLELMPSWRVGSVDSSLIGKYRTFEVGGENLYNFIKSTVQKSYNCIFEFDAFERKINVRDASSMPATKPVFLSHTNLISELELKEVTEGIATRLDVNGAEGVDIRDVNPTGTNYLINLDYFMTQDNFEQGLIDKYRAWKEACADAQQEYYNRSIEYTLQVMQKTTAEAHLTTLRNELTDLENQQAVAIQGGSSLVEINTNIISKTTEINAKVKEIEDINTEMSTIYSALADINNRLRFDKYFNEDEYLLLDRYLIDESVSESSFVANETSSYSNSDIGNAIANVDITISESSVTATVNDSGKYIYSMRQGNVKVGEILSGIIIRGAFEVKADNSFVFTGYLSNGKINGEAFATGCISMSGTLSLLADTLKDVDNLPNLFENREGIVIGTVSNGYLYFTKNTTQYEKRAVQWDLYEYGEEVLNKISQPTYNFAVTSANFLDIGEFVTFKNQLEIGEKLYVAIDEDKILTPICIGVKAIYGAAQNSLSVEFSDSYVSGDSSFKLADLLEQSVSMGKSVDMSKYTYSAFIDSGANTEVRNFMSSALDVSKNAILSSKNQAISWTDSGIRLRKWTDETQSMYEPYQMWLNNNNILITKDNWESAEVAIGRFSDDNIGECYGIIAPNIVGTLLAGENLVIESAKKDGDTAVFRVDADGCVLYNTTFDIIKSGTQISLHPDYGIAIGSVGDNSPLYTFEEDDNGNITRVINTNNAKFYVDTNGNLIFKGTLQGANGEFSGKILAKEGYIGYESDNNPGWTIKTGCIYSGKTSFNDSTPGIYIGTDGINIGAQNIGAQSTAYFKVDSLGNLTANNATITGRLTADGVIGSDDGTGWQVSDCAIYNGKSSLIGGTDGVYVGTDGISVAGQYLQLTYVDVNSGDAYERSEVGTVIIQNNGNLLATGKVSIDHGNIVLEPGSSIGTFDLLTAQGAIWTYPGLQVGKCCIYAGNLYVGLDTGSDKSRVQADSLIGTLYGEVVTLSDKHSKYGISPLADKHDILFDHLLPSTYKYHDGTSGRLHIGFIAQDVGDAICSAGMSTQDFAGLVVSKSVEDDSETWMLRYDEFIALNTYQIQKLKARVAELENKLATLTA